MSSFDLKAARIGLSLSPNQVARILHLKGKHAGHTVRRWETGDTPIPAYVGIIFDLAMHVPGALEHLKENQATADE